MRLKMPVDFLNFGTAQNHNQVPVPKVDKSKKVRRLRAGQVPDFAKNKEDDSGDSDNEEDIEEDREKDRKEDDNHDEENKI